MISPERFGCRVIGLVLATLSFLLFDQTILSATVALFAILAPISFLPLTLSLRRLGATIVAWLAKPILIIVYLGFFAPYGIFYQIFSRKTAHIYKEQSLKDLDFNSEI